MQTVRFIVLWSLPGSRFACEADIYASSPAEARDAFRRIPGNSRDRIHGVKYPKGNGRFI